MATNVFPVQLQNNPEIYAQNQVLKNLRAEFALAASKVHTQAFSIKRAMADIPLRIQDTIAKLKKMVEYAVVPKDRAADYAAGVVALSEYTSDETLLYYNGLCRLSLFFRGVDVAMIGIRQSKDEPSDDGTQSTTGFGVLDSDEFETQGFQRPTTETQYQYKYYTVVQGDTLQSIAYKTIGDPLRWPILARVNGLTNQDFIGGTVIGQTIRVPIAVDSYLNRGERNLVYEPYFEGTDQARIDQFLYGQDLNLVNRDMSVDGQGDLLTVSGLDCVIQNIEDRLATPRGALNGMTPTYGLPRFREAGAVPYLVALDRHLTDIENQCMADPRVINATINRRGLVQNGDALYAENVVTLTGGRTDKIIVKVG